MKNILTILCAIIASHTFAQSFIDEAAMQPTYNSNGDPVTNIMDQDGMRQGEWYYSDYNGNEVAKHLYLNNQINHSFIKINGVWTLTGTGMNNDTQLEQSLAIHLSNFGVSLSSDQQILVVFSDQNSVEQITGLGNWNEQDFITSKSIIENYLINNAQSYNQTTYILF